MKKIKKLFLAFLMVLPLSACKINDSFFYDDKKDDQTNQEEQNGPVWLNQSYVGKNVSDTTPMSDSPVIEEYEILSIKLMENHKAYLIANGKPYLGTYTVSETNENEITLTVMEEVLDENYDEQLVERKFKIFIGENNASINDLNEESSILKADSIQLNEQNDFTFENGLYSHVAGCPGHRPCYKVEFGGTESSGYTLKLSDDEIYTSDSVYYSYAMGVEAVGNVLVYTRYADYKKEIPVETNLFFVEKKGEHDEEFVELLGDLDYVIYHLEDEGDINPSRYYDAKITDLPLKITSDITFNATKAYIESIIFEGDEEDSIETVNANFSLTLKTDGTVSFVVTGNDDYNINTSGKWYNIGYGVMIKLDDAKFYDGIFSIGLDLSENNESAILNDFINTAGTELVLTDTDEKYEYLVIGWGEEVAKELDWRYSTEPKYLGNSYHGFHNDDEITITFTEDMKIQITINGTMQETSFTTPYSNDVNYVKYYGFENSLRVYPTYIEVWNGFSELFEGYDDFELSLVEE